MQIKFINIMTDRLISAMETTLHSRQHSVLIFLNSPITVVMRAIIIIHK